MLTTFLLVLTAARAAPKAPDAEEQVPVVDVSAFRDRIVLLEDGAGSVVAVRRDAPGDAVFFGDGARVWALQIVGSYSEGDTGAGPTSFDVTALDFRAPTRRAGVSLREGRGVVEPRLEAPLLQQPRAQVLARHGEDLERVQGAEVLVAHPVDAGHAPSAELVLDAVAVDQRAGDEAHRVGLSGLRNPARPAYRP
jgi:hypothetical protein